MTFVLVFIVTTVLSIALADVIRRLPVLFYVLAFIAVATLYAGAYGLIDGDWWKPLVILVRRCTVALSLFSVVMFIGVLSRKTRFGLRMRSVRAELSIIACILCLGHMCMYSAAYADRMLKGTLKYNVMTSLVLAIVLFVLLVILSVTSLRSVKRRMRAQTWKRVQLLAYPFFALIYVHIVVLLAPSALSRGGLPAVNMAAYTIVFGVYLVLRLWRYTVDRRLESAKESTGAAGVSGATA